MRYLQRLASLLGFMAMAVFLHIAYSYHFFYVEQLQLFQWTTDYWCACVREVGGLSHWIGECLTQYFAFPYAGPLILSALLLLVTLATRSLLQVIAPRREPFLLYLLPAFGLLLLQFDFNYLLKGTVAFGFVELALLGWLRMEKKTLRSLMAVGLTLFLYGIAGPVALLFPLCALVIDLLNRAGKGALLGDILALVAFVGIAALSVELTWVRDSAFAWTAQAYYHPVLSPPSILHLVAISLPVALLLACLWRVEQPVSQKRRILEGCLQMVLFVALVVILLPRLDHRAAYHLKQLDYANRQGDWEEVIRLSQGSLQNYLYINYLNRALMERGELGDRAFAFDQHGPQGLLVGWDKTFSVSLIRSDIYFSLGEIALSQEMAFEANVSMLGAGSPRCLMRLVQTNLIFGAYPIAEKYLQVLEQTVAYRDWAQRHRAFLYHDEAVEADPVLGAKRRGLPRESDLAGIHGLEQDLLVRARQTPSDRSPITFLGVSLLLSKDLKGFQALLDQCYGSELLPQLPISFQEAVIMLTEKYPDRWMHYQVSEAVIARFNEYRNLVLKNRGNAQLPALIQRYFGSTYWAYYLLTK